ncbi:hypothetical protein [Photobacterium sp. GB-72]|uniref:hypothetical protein n=1 Tax=Photobacterium sp. GB-72 TaxID=2022105 RepID=UPI000D15A9D4|nr:hypothetical protein [Photobacterium sp. GB-72]PSV27631.1 hypothetical protein C9J40_20055 [Photobacterium sp. GB-72]
MHLNVYHANLLHFSYAAVYELLSNDLGPFADEYYRNQTMRNVIAVHEKGVDYIIGLKPEYIKRYKENPLFNKGRSPEQVSLFFKHAMQQCPAADRSIFFQSKDDFAWFFNLPAAEQIEFINSTHYADTRYFIIESSLLELMDSIIDKFNFIVELANDHVPESSIKLIMNDNQFTYDLIKPFIVTEKKSTRVSKVSLFEEIQKLFAKKNYFMNEFIAYNINQQDVNRKIEILKYIKSECNEHIGQVDYKTILRFIRKEINYLFEHQEWDANLYSLGKLFLPKGTTFDKTIDKWFDDNNKI